MGNIEQVLALGVGLTVAFSACSSSDDSNVTILYNEYSQTPSIGRGTGSSTDPQDPGFGAMRFFIQNVMDYTDDSGPDALPAGQKVVFQPDQATGREVNALRAGIQFANKNGPAPLFSGPSWGFIYNSWPFGIRFEQMIQFLYEAEIEREGFRGNGIELAQWMLDSRGGTQIVFPVIGSTMQVSGYFPEPIGVPDCNEGDTECLSHGDGIGLRGCLGDPDAGGDLDCSPALALGDAVPTESNCSQNIGQVGARYIHSPSWHQPYLLAWIHIDKDIWNGLNTAQQDAIRRAARDSAEQSFQTTESVQCARLKDMLDINQGIDQRNVDGTYRLVEGNRVSAAMTLATWPDDALNVLLEARDGFMASLEGPAEPAEKTEAQQDFTVIWGSVQQFVESIGAENFSPGTFPATTGLVPGQDCSLVN